MDVGGEIGQVDDLRYTGAGDAGDAGDLSLVFDLAGAAKRQAFRRSLEARSIGVPDRPFYGSGR